MFASVSFGAVPLFECSVSQEVPDFENISYQQCQRFINLIRQKFGHEPNGVSFLIGSPAIAFPNYYEVECHFDGQNFQAFIYVLKCRENLPKTWKDNKPFFNCLN